MLTVPVRRARVSGDTVVTQGRWQTHHFGESVLGGSVLSEKAAGSELVFLKQASE